MFGERVVLLSATVFASIASKIFAWIFVVDRLALGFCDFPVATSRFVRGLLPLFAPNEAFNFVSRNASFQSI